MHLSTWQFQAPDFYRAQGFRELAGWRIICGPDMYYFVKVL